MQKKYLEGHPLAYNIMYLLRYLILVKVMVTVYSFSNHYTGGHWGRARNQFVGVHAVHASSRGMTAYSHFQLVVYVSLLSLGKTEVNQVDL